MKFSFFMGPVVIFFLTAFLIRTLRDILYIVFLWQLKEYRLDRILAHLKTSSGKKLIFGRFSILKWILFFGAFGLYIQVITNGFSGEISMGGLIGVFSAILFWPIWFIEAILNIREFILYRWRRPHFTLKVFFILLTVFFTFYSLLSTEVNLFFAVKVLFLAPLIDRFSLLYIGLLVILLNIPIFLFKKLMIFLAKRKISGFHKLITIGVTGSYGKTSTKEFLVTILNEKFKVAKTPEFTNTDIGIAKYILKQLGPDNEVFVVEMGAYKRGEIKVISDMVKPKIGVITGINEQHLDLFGSIENTMKTKFELIESLPNSGVAIFNGNNSYCLKMIQWAKARGIKVLTYNITNDVKNIRVYTDRVEFIIVDKNKNYQITAKLLGRQTTENLLAAIFAARNLGMTFEEIKTSIDKIVPPAKTMKLAKKINGMSLIDDTFNANPDGVIAAVDFMKTFNGKKIIVLTPLIELGEEAKKIHLKLGEKLAKICDLILLTNLNYHKSFSDGAKLVGEEDKLQVVNTFVGLKLIKENLDKDGIVVFEGKEAGKILRTLVKLD